MDPFLPFACPDCGLPSVAVGICPECRVQLVARAMAPRPSPPPAEAVSGEEARSVFRGLPQDCERAAQRLGDAGIPVAMAMAPEEKGRLRAFHLLVPVGWEPRALELLAADWEREAEALGHAPVTGDEALALEARGLCPACGDALMPEAAQCPSCGIALA